MNGPVSPATRRRSEFLLAHGLSPGDAEPLPGDASARRYHRLASRGLLLMEEAPGASALDAFVSISRLLNAAGPSAPRVHAVDWSHDLALVEDFGTRTFTRLLAEGVDEALDRRRFLADYRLLAAHRHTKILGNFERPSNRDGKHGYLAHIPRVQRLLAAALEQAGLAAIRDMMNSRLPGWATHKPLAPVAGGRKRSGTA
jgi:aminoglycoside/choline kinase family phosphotransferase